MIFKSATGTELAPLTPAHTIGFIKMMTKEKHISILVTHTRSDKDCF